MPEGEPADSARDAADALRVARHQQLCTAIPFPRLRWCTPAESNKSLAERHDYAVQLANSAIDWNLREDAGGAFSSTTCALCRGRQHEGIAQLYDLLGALRID